MRGRMCTCARGTHVSSLCAVIAGVRSTSPCLHQTLLMRQPPHLRRCCRQELAEKIIAFLRYTEKLNYAITVGTVGVTTYGEVVGHAVMPSVPALEPICGKPKISSERSASGHVTITFKSPSNGPTAPKIYWTLDGSAPAKGLYPAARASARRCFFWFVARDSSP